MSPINTLGGLSRSGNGQVECEYRGTGAVGAEDVAFYPGLILAHSDSYLAGRIALDLQPSALDYGGKAHRKVSRPSQGSKQTVAVRAIAFQLMLPVHVRRNGAQVHLQSGVVSW